MPRVYCQNVHRILKEGDLVSNIKLSLFSQNKDVKSIELKDLTGKIIILDFWATWCGPCIPEIYKLTKLKDAFGDRLVIIAISQETKEDILRTIKHMPKQSVLFASDTSHLNYFQYKTIPTSVIIDKKGIIRSFVTPDDISDTMIDRLIRTDTIYQKSKKRESVKSDYISQSDNNIYESIVSSYNPNESTVIKFDTLGNNKTVNFINFTLPSLFREIFRMPAQSWVIDNTNDSSISIYEPENMYSVKIKRPYSTIKDLFFDAQDILNSAFQIKGKLVTQNETVYVLKHKNNSLLFLPLDSTKEKFSYYGPNFNGNGVKISTLVDYLSNELGYLENKIVIDETSINTQFNIKLQWEYTNRSSLDSALAEYGFYIEKEKRKVNMLLLDKNNDLK